METEQKTFVCSECDKTCKAINKVLVQGDPFCKKCVRILEEDDALFKCVRCDEYEWTTEGRYAECEHGMLCNGCYEELYFSCESCGDVYHNDDMHGDCYCENCYEPEPGDEEYEDETPQEYSSPSFTNRYTDRTKNFQDDEAGSVIKSNRTFGIEVEAIVPHPDFASQLQRKLHEHYSFGGDGSIRTKGMPGIMPHGIEVQTPIYKGRAGENEVRNFFELLKTYKFNTNDSCGEHIHIGIQDLVDRNDEELEIYIYPHDDLHKAVKNARETLNIEDTIIRFAAGDQKVLKTIYQGLIHGDYNRAITCIKSLPRYQEWIKENPDYIIDIEGIMVCSEEPIKKTRKVKNDLHGFTFANEETTVQDRYIEVEEVIPQGDTRNIGVVNLRKKREDWKTEIISEAELRKKTFVRMYQEGSVARFTSLRSLLYAYKVYEDILFSMVDASRHGNRFCKRLPSYMTLEAIAKCNRIEDIERLWYDTKNPEARKRGGKYDESRYCAINLHTFFQRGGFGTLEVRLLGGVINAEKVLNWIALNQAIIDTAVNKPCEYFAEAGKELDMSKKLNLFFKHFNLPKKLRKYVIDEIKASGTNHTLITGIKNGTVCAE